MTVIVKGVNGILAIAVGQKQERLVAAFAQFFDVQRIAGFCHQACAVACHLIGDGQIQTAVTGHEILHIAGGHIRRAYHGKDRVVIIHRAAVAAGIGIDGNGIGVRQTLQPCLGQGGAAVHNGVESAGFGNAGQIDQHIKAHSAEAKIIFRPQHHGGQLIRGGFQGLAALITHRFAFCHGTVAVHICKIFQNAGI